MFLILQYHDISKGFSFNPGVLPVSFFKKHIIELKFFNFNNLDFVDFCSFQNESRNKGNSVLITFDDGYKSVFENAMPIMDTLGFKGIVFVVTNYLGSRSNWEVPLLTSIPHLNIEEIKMLRNKGWIIGSHSHYHKDLTWMSIKELRADIETSKMMLEDILGETVTFFSYPFGKYNERVKDVLRETGFKYAFKSSGTFSSFIDPLEIPRRTIYITDFTLKFKIDPFYSVFEIKKEIIFNKFAYLSPVALKLLNLGKSNPSNDK